MSMISVVVPVYKVELFLGRCVDSILAQTYKDFDLILIDDGSPDRCGEICEDYAARDPRVHVLHCNNTGLSGARNAGIEWSITYSDSEWITFIDSDDWIHPFYLELLYQAVKRTGLSAAVGDFEKMEEDRALFVDRSLPETIIDTELFYCEDKVTATVAWGKLYKKRDYISVRYPVGKIHEDEFTTYKVLFKYKKIAFVNQPIYAYFQNSLSITRSEWTPKHLAEIEGMLEELNFFKKKGFTKAYAYTAKTYLNSIYRNLQKAKSYGNLYKAETREMKQELQWALWKYSGLANVSIKKNRWLYYEAFPLLTLPYRAVRKVYKK